MAFEKCPTCGEMVASVKRHFCMGKDAPECLDGGVPGFPPSTEGIRKAAVGLPKGPATATNSAGKRPKSSGSGLGAQAETHSLPQRTSADARVGASANISTASKGSSLPETKSARSSAGSEQRTSNSQVAGSNPAELANSRARRQAVKASGFDPDTARSNRAAPVKKPGRPRLGEQRDRPWEAAGMSRATWYRRRAEQKEGK